MLLHMNTYYKMVVYVYGHLIPSFHEENVRREGICVPTSLSSQ